MNLEQRINDLLRGRCRTVVRFLEEALADVESLDPPVRNLVMGAIVRRAKGGPLLKPLGLGEPLGGKLSGIAKIKLRRYGIRVAYCPLEKGDTIVMEIIAVRPRAGDEVYRIAAQRLPKLKQGGGTRRE